MSHHDAKWLQLLTECESQTCVAALPPSISQLHNLQTHRLGSLLFAHPRRSRASY